MATKLQQWARQLRRQETKLLKNVNRQRVLAGLPALASWRDYIWQVQLEQRRREN